MQARAIEARNPFSYGGLALDEAFADRESEVAELKSDAMNGQDVVVFAPRRYGKSSLVSAVSQELVAAGLLVADVDLMRAPSKEKLADHLAKTIFDNIASRLDRVREKALSPFNGLRIKPVVTVDPGTGELSFSFSADAGPQDVEATLERLLELPAELAADRGKKAVLVIDEFQEILQLDPKLPNLMRSVFQRQSDVSHIYLGSKRHLMEQIFNDANEPFWRSAKTVELGPIPVDRFAEFIAERFRGTGKDVEEAALTSVLEMTNGHPYATQELCYALWEETAPGKTASPAELTGAVAAVLRSENAHFDLLWDDAASRQREVLEALAQEPGKPFTRGYRQKYRLPESSSIQRAVRALTEQELIAKTDAGIYRIVEPFFGEWIVQNIVKPAGREALS
jgi:uncharacterized protein